MGYSIMWNAEERKMMEQSRRMSEEAARMRAMKNNVAADRKDNQAAMWAEMAAVSMNNRVN